MYYTKKSVQLGQGGGGPRPPRNSPSLFLCTLKILRPRLDERVNMHVNIIEKKQSSTLNNIGPKACENE